MRFGIIANLKRPDAELVLTRLHAWADKNDVSLAFCDSLEGVVDDKAKMHPRSELAKHSDVVISLGGDGTMLAAARAVGIDGTPILGINLGSLGFLTQLTPAALEQTLSSVLAKQYKIEKRMVARVEIEGAPEVDSPYALNDVVIDRGSVSRIIHLDLYVNDYFVCSYDADGLIISTPTGSTAYSLAAGGPIVVPTMDAFLVSPISPFALTSRPVVFPDDDLLRIITRSEHSDPVLTLDGQVSCKMPQESSVLIRRADFCVNFITFHDNAFYDVLRDKLHWGRLPRAGDE
jgi:NAD+ kinase